MDESRFGLRSIPRRCITIKGVKPVLSYQHRFQNFYLFGAYSPTNGDSLTLELPHCNADCFQLFLDTLAKHQPEEFKIILLDNGAFHHSRQLQIPKNIHLLFLPPYSPELNPAEKIWRHIKDKLANQTFETLKDISDAIAHIVQQTSQKSIASITGWSLYKNCVN